MKTVTDVNTVNQLLTYSKQAEAGIHQKAIQMLLGAGNNKKQDSLSISDAARGFSKQSIAALIDKNANISNSELAYYFANYNNSSAILDAINFGENAKLYSCTQAPFLPPGFQHYQPYICKQGKF